MRLKHHNSDALWKRATASLAGGVSSNVRARAKQPLYYDHAEGTRLYDVDGNTFLDYALGQGPMLLGHSPRPVLDYVQREMNKGQLYAGQHALEVQLAEKLTQLIPCAEQVRFGNSGSEAVHVALRLARACTGREKHIKFEGHYHGWFDDELVSVHPPLEAAGSREAPATVPVSAGQSKHVVEQVIVLPWNDIDILRDTVSRYGDEIASIIMEPVMCNTGCIPPQDSYLQAVRELCDEYGIVLIFDEIITGFRMGLDGAQGYYDVMPDLATFGKAMASGFPVSCLAGKGDFMEHIASLRVNHSGTYNSNVMSMAAAYATVTTLEAAKDEIYGRLYGLGHRLMDGLRDLGTELELDVLVQGIGPMFHLAFTAASSMTDYRTFLQSDEGRYQHFAQMMLNEGIRILPRGLWYLSAAHTDEDIDHTLHTVRHVWEQMRQTNTIST